MSRLHVYAQLVRLPNLPSALSNICLGAVATGALPQRWLPFGLLLLSSACLYCGGMVWNDYFDIEQDKKERSFRPLPSEKISLGEAARLGAVLLAAGVLFAAVAGWALSQLDPAARAKTPIVLAVCLVVAIFLYNGGLKRTWCGPISMGLCRFLNVLLGVSASGSLPWPRGPHLALVVGLYVAGVTWFARTEARLSSQAMLRGAAAVMLLSLVLALMLPVPLKAGESSPLFPYLLVTFGFVVGLPVCQAIADPVPSRVQAAVKRCLMGLIALDAILATGVVGATGLVILLLLAPAVYLNRWRWLYAT
jgi:4-hydroxybenzoate polyprenyltransferase